VNFVRSTFTAFAAAAQSLFISVCRSLDCFTASLYCRSSPRQPLASPRLVATPASCSSSHQQSASSRRASLFSVGVFLRVCIGGGWSPERTALHVKFPANREKYREICEFCR
jgi:hypothetical protein